MLNRKTAQKIATETASICGHSISIIDTNGVIIGSDDLSRIDTIHQGLETVFNDKKHIAHNQEEVQKISGAKAGMAFPIIVNNQVIGAVGIVGNPDEISKYAQLVKHQVEMMYQQEIYHQLSQLQLESIEILVQELMNTSTKNLHYLRLLAEANDIKLSEPLLPIIVTVENDLSILHSDKDLILKTNSLIDSLVNGQHKKPVLVSKLNATEIIILIPALPASEVELQITLLMSSLNKTLRGLQINESYTLVGRSYPRVDGLKKSINEVKDCLALLKKMDLQKGLYYVNNLNLETLLASVVQYNLNTLTNDIRIKHFLEMDSIFHTTLVKLCECNLNISDASRNLHIHRNTLLYRLNKIQEVTSLKPTLFNSSMMLYLALKLNYLK